MFEKGIPFIQESPKDNGTLELIVRRPATDCREVLSEALLTMEEGLAGDNWNRRRNSRTADGSPHPETQLTLMNSRVIALLAGERENWPPAGDQLFVDLDLSAGNLPPGTRLSVGDAVIEVTAQPHNGCTKFSARFGVEALRFISSPTGKQLRMRGIYAKVIRPGSIRAGDQIRKLPD